MTALLLLINMTFSIGNLTFFSWQFAIVIDASSEEFFPLTLVRLRINWMQMEHFFNDEMTAFLLLISLSFKGDNLKLFFCQTIFLFNSCTNFNKIGCKLQNLLLIERYFSYLLLSSLSFVGGNLNHFFLAIYLHFIYVYKEDFCFSLWYKFEFKFQLNENCPIYYYTKRHLIKLFAETMMASKCRSSAMVKNYVSLWKESRSIPTNKETSFFLRNSIFFGLKMTNL